VLNTGTSGDETNDDAKFGAIGAIVGGSIAFMCIAMWGTFGLCLKFKTHIVLGETEILSPKV